MKSITAIIVNLSKDDTNTQALFKQLQKIDPIKEIFLVGVKHEQESDFDKQSCQINISTSVNVATDISFIEELSKLISTIKSDYIAIIPSCFTLSNKIIDTSLEYLNRDNCAFVLESLAFNYVNEQSRTTSSKIYAISTLKPRSDYKNIVFVRKNDLKLYLDTISNNSLSNLKRHYVARSMEKYLAKDMNRTVYYIVNDCFEFHLDKDIENLLRECDAKDEKLAIENNIFAFETGKHENEYDYPRDSVEFEKESTPLKDVAWKNKKVCLFAAFSSDGYIREATKCYLREIRKKFGYIIFVADCKVLPKEAETIPADYIIVKRHHEYDFGSWKRGFELLLKNNVLGKIDKILLTNDSVNYVGSEHDFTNIIDKSANHDAFSMAIDGYGYGEKVGVNSYTQVYNPFMESWFLLLSKNIFRTDWFKDFMLSVTQESEKEDVVKKYEMGLSWLIKDKGFKLNSYYPFDENLKIFSLFIYLNPYLNDKPLFTKTRFYK